MIIHDQDQAELKIIDENRQDCPIFFQVCWRTVLRCFSFMEAIEIDSHFGYLETFWRISQEPTYSLFSNQIWNDGVELNNLGFLIYVYLQKFPIHPNDIDRYIQYSTNKGKLTILIFFLNCYVTEEEWEKEKKIYYFRNELKQRIENTSYIPNIYEAIKNRHLHIIEFLKNIYKNDQYEKMIQKNEYSSIYKFLIKNNEEKIFVTIFPDILKEITENEIHFIIVFGRLNMMRWIIKNTTLEWNTKAWTNLMELCCTLGKVSLLQMIHDIPTNPCQLTFRLFELAFQKGKYNMCMYLKQKMALSNTYIGKNISKETLEIACQLGNIDVLSILPKKFIFPLECYQAASKTKNNGCQVMKFLYEERQLPLYFQWSMEYIENTIKVGNDENCLYIMKRNVFRLEEFAKEYLEKMIAMVMLRSLQYMHFHGFDVYNSKTLLLASQLGVSDVIADIFLFLQNPFEKISMDDIREAQRRLKIIHNDLKTIEYIENALKEIG